MILEIYVHPAGFAKNQQDRPRAKRLYEYPLMPSTSSPLCLLEYFPRLRQSIIFPLPSSLVPSFSYIFYEFKICYHKQKEVLSWGELWYIYKIISSSTRTGISTV